MMNRYMKLIFAMSLFLNICFIINYAVKHHTQEVLYDTEMKVYKYVEQNGLEAGAYESDSFKDWKIQGSKKYQVQIKPYADPKTYTFYINSDGNVELIDILDIDGVHKTPEEVSNNIFENDRK